MYTGTKESEGVFTIQAPPTYPDKNYFLDGDQYIFIIENKELQGAVKLQFAEFYLHPKSFITVSELHVNIYVKTTTYFINND